MNKQDEIKFYESRIRTVETALASGDIGEKAAKDWRVRLIGLKQELSELEGKENEHTTRSDRDGANA